MAARKRKTRKSKRVYRNSKSKRSSVTRKSHKQHLGSSNGGRAPRSHRTALLKKFQKKTRDLTKQLGVALKKEQTLGAQLASFSKGNEGCDYRVNGMLRCNKSLGHKGGHSKR